MKQLTPQQRRALRRRHKHERQAVIFGSLVAGLALAGLSASAIYTGAMDGAFLDREFTTKTPEGSIVRSAPCPPPGEVSVPYASIPIHVLNSTSKKGLAASTAALLASRGFDLVDAGNYPTPFDGAARIQFGVTGLPGAYTLASTIPNAVLMLDTRKDASVDLVLGTTWEEAMVPREEVTLTLGDPLVGVPGCVPVAEALVNAPTGPTATPTPTATATPTAPATAAASGA